MFLWVFFSSCDQMEKQDALGQAGFMRGCGSGHLFGRVRGGATPRVQPDPRVAESSRPFRNNFSFEIILPCGVAEKKKRKKEICHER